MKRQLSNGRYVQTLQIDFLSVKLYEYEVKLTWECVPPTLIKERSSKILQATPGHVRR